jgi:hypothetical protein
MNDVSDAKQKAIQFLSESIKVPWYDVCPGDDEPLIFEAWSYLANKGKINKLEWGKKIKEIWNNWRTDPFFKEQKIFWPAADRHYWETGPDDYDYEIGFDVENHIAMFRAREIFAIPGYEDGFVAAKRKLIEKLKSRWVLYRPEEHRILWQIVRSPFLRASLQDYLRSIATEIVETNNTLKEPLSPIEIFFLLVTNFGDESHNLARKNLEQQIDDQGANGSFHEHIISTCLCLNSIHLTGIDPNKVISDTAIQWLINRQKENGAWSYYGFDPLIKLSAIIGKDMFWLFDVLNG